MTFKTSSLPLSSPYISQVFRENAYFGDDLNLEKQGKEFSRNDDLGFHTINLPEKFKFIVPKPKIAIFLSTYDGEKYLSDQLSSIINQSYDNWKVYACDDCSSDGTLSILRDFHAKYSSKIDVKPNQKNTGYISNFLSMACDKTIKADLYAYADQDDVWEAEKLERAVEWIASIPKDCPALYCGRTITVDENNITEGFSPLFSRPPSFANAIVQSIGGGNTMVFNNAARDLINEAGVDVNVASHDWWSYILVSGCGGQVFYDPEPSIRYRQHSGNFIGTNNSFLARLKRVYMLFQNRFKTWNQGHIDSLSKMDHRLTPEKKETLKLFSEARESSFPKRLLKLKKSKVYRQTLLGNIGLITACILKKL